MIQKKQQGACLSSKHRPSCGGPGRRPRLGSCAVGALAWGPSQPWPPWLLAKPCDFRPCCNLQAELLPAVHILKLKRDFPHNSIYQNEKAEATGRLLPGKLSPHPDIPTQWALEEGEISTNPEILSLAITPCGRNRHSRWLNCVVVTQHFMEEKSSLLLDSLFYSHSQLSFEMKHLSFNANLRVQAWLKLWINLDMTTLIMRRLCQFYIQQYSNAITTNQLAVLSFKALSTCWWTNHLVTSSKERRGLSAGSQALVLPHPMPHSYLGSQDMCSYPGVSNSLFWCWTWVKPGRWGLLKSANHFQKANGAWCTGLGMVLLNK